MRSLSEVQDAAKLLTAQVWYNKHRILREQVAAGEIKIVAKLTPGSGQREIRRDIWEGAQATAKKTEDQYGLERLGPWADFEWGVLSGQRLALNWVLGEEWDGGGLGV